MDICRKFVSGQIFEKQWQKLGLDDDDLSELQMTLLENPKSGEVIQGTGRLRKMRFKYGNRGKSYCARVCYVDFEINGIVVFLMIFEKNDMENLTDTEKKELKKIIEQLERSIA